MNQDLLLALLSVDVYNRGYGQHLAGLNVNGYRRVVRGPRRLSRLPGRARQLLSTAG